MDPKDQQSDHIGSISDSEIVKDIITRMYGCQIVQYIDNNVTLVKPAVANKSHCNLLPALLAIETKSAFTIFYEQTTKYSLRE